MTESSIRRQVMREVVREQRGNRIDGVPVSSLTVAQLKELIATLRDDMIEATIEPPEETTQPGTPGLRRLRLNFLVREEDVDAIMALIGDLQHAAKVRQAQHDFADPP